MDSDDIAADAAGRGRRPVHVPRPRSPEELGDRPARGLVERAQATDRQDRFGARLAEVRATMHVRTRRARVREWLLDGMAAVVGIIVGTAVGVFTSGWVGIVTAGGVGIGVAAGRRVAGRLARRRGAAAWDWQAGRHRLLGRPASRVQDLDRPDRRPPGLFG